MNVLVVFISTLGALSGAVLGSRTTLRAQRDASAVQARGELVHALSEFADALDSVHRELRSLPRTTRLQRLGNMTINRERLPNLDFFLRWTSAKTFGSDAMAAVDRFSRAANLAQLLAPTELLPTIERLHRLLATWEMREDGWETDWQQTRGELLAASRALLSAP